MATNDFSRLEIRRSAGDADLLAPPAGGGHPPLIALLLEAIATECPETPVVVRPSPAGSWSVDVGLGLTRGMAIYVVPTSGPIAALVMLAPHTRLASAGTIASGLSFTVLSLASMLYFFFGSGFSGRGAIGAGFLVGAAVAAPLFGLAWLVDNVINPLGPRAVARVNEALASRVASAAGR